MRRMTVLVVSVLLAGSVVLALVLRRSGSPSDRAVTAASASGVTNTTAPLTSSTTSADATTPSAETTVPTWTVALSRDSAIAIVRQMTVREDANNTYEAKLLSWSEYGPTAGYGGPTPGLANSDPVWAVEVQGQFRPPLGGPIVPWGVDVLSAQNGQLVASDSGPGAPPSYWSSFPDHGPAAGS
jgi:hypothetical protein